MSSILFIINDAPYGSEKAYNALRLAFQLKRDAPEKLIRVFLMADAVLCALPGQKTPEGYYNIERYMKGLIGKGCEVKLCGTCMDARGLSEVKLIDGTLRSNLAELSAWVLTTDKILTF